MSFFTRKALDKGAGDRYTITRVREILLGANT
jgi:hypothetical protein